MSHIQYVIVHPDLPKIESSCLSFLGTC